MATSDRLMIIGAVLVGVSGAGALLWALRGVERRLRAAAPTLEPSKKHGPWWAALGGVLTLASIAIVCVVWEDGPDVNLPNVAYALPALPMVWLAWLCFQRAGWAAARPR